MSLDILLLLSRSVDFHLTPQNIASLSYEFSCMFLFLETFGFSYIYTLPGYVSIDPQVMYSLCSQYSYIYIPRICSYIFPRSCIHSVVNILNSPLNMRFIIAYIHLCSYHQCICWICCNLLD